MNNIYLQLREEARNIVATLPVPDFYQQFASEITYSRQMLHSHPLLIRIKQEINPVVEDDFGHGMRHSDLVSVDAGAIIQVEMQNMKSQTSRMMNQILLVQVAGLLHDIKRKEKKHSIKGARFARTFLSTGRYPLTEDEIDVICCAINEHEAFQKKHINHKEITASQNNSLISNALYDADKFRWGPDNFTHTLWDMVMFSNAPLTEFIRRYPAGMAILEQIKGTFRTETGKIYGPDFIDLGIETGNRLFRIIKTSNLVAEQ